ncbi:MAG: hypothetical protein MUO40_09185 [Anaerolineaceae bacterium]|nr:hypothetical protein [Anaerolineaceae bacterium]
MKTFALDQEYLHCVNDLAACGVLEQLPKANTPGVIGFDGVEYPLPTLEQVSVLFERNQSLVTQKKAQGFVRLEITPLALALPGLCELLRSAIIRHGEAGTLYQTRRTEAEPLVPLRVNLERHVWVWETMREVFDTDALRYFPRDYHGDPVGQTKADVLVDKSICAFPGWSVGLVEDLPFLPKQGEGLTLSGRKQLEICLSPRESLQLLNEEPYAEESGRTIEEFILNFLIRLETSNQVSHDVADENALWCLGQYVRISYAEVVPTGRWIRQLGRVRLDMHRTGNKKCAQAFGVSTVVRLQG